MQGKSSSASEATWKYCTRELFRRGRPQTVLHGRQGDELRPQQLARVARELSQRGLQMRFNARGGGRISDERTGKGRA